jgi:ribosome-associated protein
MERRRERLLADDAALTELREKHPELDVQHMRTLIRNARREQAENKPPRAYREIFQILKQLQANANAAASAAEDEEPSDEE